MLQEQLHEAYLNIAQLLEQTYHFLQTFFQEKLYLRYTFRIIKKPACQNFVDCCCQPSCQASPPCWSSCTNEQRILPKQHALFEWRQFKMADDPADFHEEEFYRKLLLGETKKLENLTPDRHEFVPKPGYVMKLRNSKDEKVFINVCTSDKIPAPKEVSDQELTEILQSVDPTQYRVPMSLGEPHVEVDNRGQGEESLVSLDKKRYMSYL